MRLAGVAAVMALVASGCTPGEAGAAAVVGDRRITTDQLQGALTGLREGNPEFAQVEQLVQLVLFDLIAAPYLLEAANSAGLGVAPSEAQAALPQTLDANPDALRALQAQIAFNKLSQGQKGEALASVADRLRRAKVRVSPRYGRFDAATLAVAASQPNWLVPKAEPAPTDAPPTTP